MSANIYLICVIMYVLGIFLHLFWIKIPSLKKKAAMASCQFSLLDWWKTDYNVILGNAVFGAMLLFGLKELILWKPNVADYVKWFFAFMGTFGNSVAMAKFGKFEKTLNGIIDDKLKILSESDDSDKAIT